MFNVLAQRTGGLALLDPAAPTLPGAPAIPDHLTGGQVIAVSERAELCGGLPPHDCPVQLALVDELGLAAGPPHEHGEGCHNLPPWGIWPRLVVRYCT